MPSLALSVMGASAAANMSTNVHPRTIREEFEVLTRVSWQWSSVLFSSVRFEPDRSIMPLLFWPYSSTA